ncbi:MAG: hypothetical protein PHR35_01820, partial [Kiritimatiellae bacterium]|nr:hypothetical protein [Kiritimatiellia bacterium]
ADLRIPRCFYWITKYVTPVLLGAILCFWLATDGWKTILMLRADETGSLVPLYAPSQVPWVWITRLFGLGLIAAALLLVRYAWRHGPPSRRQQGGLP